MLIMKINKNRFRNKYFWFSVVGLVFLILNDLGIATVGQEKIDEYLNLVSTILIISGIWIDPTTDGFHDNHNSSYNVYDDNDTNY